uniref:Uncharacterized protein n=1 Tax=Salarias fasciatus TaxID=181472 RepID=A0A672G295_SALFA
MGTGGSTHRQCNITITNGCRRYYLSTPRWYTDSGFCDTPFPPTIPSNDNGFAVFKKTPDTARGAVGVIVYDVKHNSSHQIIDQIAIMFRNPYDFNLYSNLFAVGILERSRNCDEDLFDEMETGTGNYFFRSKAGDGALTYRGSRVTIKATMSDVPQPVMKVDVSET